MTGQVLEILREPYSGQVFPGYEKIDLSFSGLEILVQNDRPDWKVALENVKGIYLITDAKTGKRYVGSAYGDQGIWSRWKSYIGSGHGGNTELADLACCWLNRFFQAPLMFFVYIPVDVESQPRLELVKQAIKKLEADPNVPGDGLDRSKTTLHLDYDNKDARELHSQLVREFGLLRASQGSDRDSVLLQLCDLLLGISERERSGRAFTQSKGDTRRSKVFDYAHERAGHYSARGKNNWVFSYEPDGGLRRLLV